MDVLQLEPTNATAVVVIEHVLIWVCGSVPISVFYPSF